jgi:D-alanyl-D-alanine carboxypeptidase
VEAADEHYAWLLENAPAFGWDNPAWARKGGSGPYEPWHFEYVARQ